MRACRASEQGYVLIAAIWLLILIGSVAALLLARSLTAAGAVAAESEMLQGKLARDAAIETVAADLLINGVRSPFAVVPSERTLDVSGRRVTVRISAESGKVDLNEADLSLIERVLAGLNWEAAERALFVRQLRTRRAERRPLRSPAELGSIAARSRSGGTADCLEAYFTIHSGRAEPDPAFAGAALNRILGRPFAAEGVPIPRPIGPGTPIAIHASAVGTLPTAAILRLGGLLDQPIMVSSWETRGLCT